MPAPYNSITYHTVLSAMFYSSVIFSRVGSTRGWKSQALLLAQADGFIIGTNVDYTISNQRIYLNVLMAPRLQMNAALLHPSALHVQQLEPSW